MNVTCPVCKTRYERTDYSKYAVEDCPKCNLNEIVLMKGRKRLNQFDSYDDGIKSGNRLIAIGLVLLLMMCSLAFVSAIETKGGVYNGGFEYGTGSTSTTGWIGDANYGWYSTKIIDGTHTTISYDSTTKYSGLQSLKVVSTNVADYTTQHLYSGYINQAFASNIVYSIKRYFVPVKPNTTYKLSLRVKADNITAGAGNGLNMGYSLFTDSALISSANVITDYTGTMDWTYYSSTFTTGTTAKYINIGMTNQYLSGTYYIDDVRLEEVDTVSLTSQQQGRPSLTITGVTDTNAIDQSQTNNSLGVTLGSTTEMYQAQQFTKTTTKLTGISFQKGGNIGTYTGNTLIQIRPDAGNKPSTTVLSQKNYTNAEWLALPVLTDIFVPLPTILTDTNYWIVFFSDTADNANNTGLRAGTDGSYAGGLRAYSANNSTWITSGYDLYFKTHFAKLSSSVDLNVVAPDGTSELKSYDVNGDILTDANITINPDGTGRYYWSPMGTDNLITLAEALKFSNNVYSLTGGNVTTGTLMINAIRYREAPNNDLYIGTTDGNIVTKFVAPKDCNFIANQTKITNRFYINSGTKFIQYSTDGTTWTTLASYEGFGGVEDNNLLPISTNSFYIKVGHIGGGAFTINQQSLDANLSCPGLTTPLFKNGTNTVYTMNKDADNQAGATLTPSLMSNLNFSFTAPTTTFSSSQVPNTTDQNITLTCTDNNTGCKTINYNINNLGWIKIENFPDNLLSYYRLDETNGTTATDTTGAVNGTSTNVTVNQAGKIDKAYLFNNASNGYISLGDNYRFQSGDAFSISAWINTISMGGGNVGRIFGTRDIGGGSNGFAFRLGGTRSICFTTFGFVDTCGPNNAIPNNSTWYFVTLTRSSAGAVKLYVNGSEIGAGTHASIGGTGTLAYIGAEPGQTAINFDGLIDEFGIWDSVLTTDEITALYNSGSGARPSSTDLSNYSFLYSGAGSHSIQYFSTDNSDNNETIKTSTFTTYGNGRFYFKDENSGSDLTGVQVNFNGVDYDSGANNYLDFNFQNLGSTNTTYLFTITKTGYSTRYYQTDLNYFSDFNVTFALIPTIISKDIIFKMFPPTGTSVLSNTYIEFKDKDTNYTVSRLKSNDEGELTVTLKSDDQNYLVWISEGLYIYQAVQLTVYYPKDEVTQNYITGNWRLEITDNISYQDLNIPQSTNKIIYLLPNTKYPFTIAVQDVAGTYFKRRWSKLYTGNPITDTLQPYLISADDGIAVKFVLQDPKRDSIENVVINIYKNVGGIKTLVSNGASDVTGNALFFLIAGEKYMLDFVYNGAVIFETQNYSVTSSTVYWTINLATKEIKTVDGTFITIGFNPIQDYILKNATNISYKVTASKLNRTRAEFYIIQDGNKIITYTRDTPCTTPCTVTIPIEDLNITLGNKVYLDLNVYIDSNNYIFNYKKTWSYGTTSNIDTHDLFVKARIDFGCTTNTMWPCPLTSIVSIIIMILLIGSMVFTFNFVNPKGLLVAGIGILAVFTYLGWFWWVALVLIIIASIFYLRGD